MNSMLMGEISKGLQGIVTNAPEGKNTRNALYDLTLLHKSAQDAQVALRALLKDPSSLTLYIPYSAASWSFISIPKWICEFAEENEVTSTSKVKLERVKKVFTLIRNMESPITEHHKVDRALAEKIISLWSHIEAELLSVWYESISQWDISTQMSCFNQNNCEDYVKNLIGYKCTKTDGQLATVSHFIQLYYPKVA